MPIASSNVPKEVTVLERINLPAPVKSIKPLELALNVPSELNVPVPISNVLPLEIDTVLSQVIVLLPIAALPSLIVNWSKEQSPLKVTEPLEDLLTTISRVGSIIAEQVLSPDPSKVMISLLASNVPDIEILPSKYKSVPW